MPYFPLTTTLLHGNDGKPQSTHSQQCEMLVNFEEKNNTTDQIFKLNVN